MVGLFIDLPSWFFIVDLVADKAFLICLWAKVYTNKHNPIIIAIASILSGDLRKILSAKNKASLRNPKPLCRGGTLREHSFAVPYIQKSCHHYGFILKKIRKHI
jgi:hypothetical protein